MSDDVEVFDLSAAVAEKRAEGEKRKPYTFNFGGEKYELPPYMDMLVIAYLAEGQMMSALRKLLGEEQWQRLNDSEEILDDVGLELLFNGYAKHTGQDLGKSRASTRSSRDTRKR